MKYTIRRFKLIIEEMEVEAGEPIDELFPFPTLDKKKLARANKKLMKSVSKQMKSAYKEGVNFGKHIKTITKRIKSNNKNN